MAAQPKFLIRADGNPDIATGHLMRTLSIGRALRKQNALIRFAVADETGKELLTSFFRENEDFTVYVLHSDYKDPESDLAALVPLTAYYDCLLIDSYFVTPFYLNTLRERIKIAYIDDLYLFDYPADLVINYDLIPPEDFYRTASHKLLGCSYTPLREQFTGLTPLVRPQVQNILFSTGGTDPWNVSGKLLCELLSRQEGHALHYHVLAGPMHSHRTQLEQLAGQYPQIILYEKVTDMATLMQNCDLAVSAAGTTLYELCAAGVPAISFTMADNQLNVARDMEQFIGLPCGGDVRTAADFISHTVDLLLDLSRNYEKRLKLSDRMHQAIDGSGADRIADALIAAALTDQTI